MVYGWRTTKTETGYRWQVYRFEYQKGETVLVQGTRPTREQAMGRAKKHVIFYRRQRAA